MTGGDRARHRGTMVVNSNVESMRPICMDSTCERGTRRRTSKRGNRRLSAGIVRPSKDDKPTVYRVLIHLIFAIHGFRPMYAQNAMDTLFSLTSTDKRNLSERETFMLEESLNVVHHEIDHIFQPWVTRPNLKGVAENYLDLPFLIDCVLSLERSQSTAGMSKAEKNILQPPVNKFLELLGVGRRSTL